jgi:hypothetical protein
MLQDRAALLLGELGPEQRRALAFAEAGLARATAQQPPLVRPVVIADVKVAGVALAVEPAVGVETAET